MEIEEMLKIFRELEESQSGCQFLEFAFTLNSFKESFANQSSALCEHIIKLQLYNDTTAYKTIYNILTKLWQDSRSKKAQQYLDYDFVKEHLIDYSISDEEDYNEVSEIIYSDTYEDYPSVYSERKTYKIFCKIVNICIGLVLSSARPDRKEFYKQLKEVLI